MDQMAAWDGGAALGDMARGRISTSSALAVLAAPLETTADYLRAGETLQRLWISAERAGLAVHPWSPLFLYARGSEDLASWFRRAYVAQTAALAERLWDLAAMPRGMAPVLLLRLSVAAPPPTISRREWPRIRHRRVGLSA